MGIYAILISNFPLDLNLTRGHISPQFNVDFEKPFPTALSFGINDKPPKHQKDMFHELHSMFIFDEHGEAELVNVCLEPGDIA